MPLTRLEPRTSTNQQRMVPRGINYNMICFPYKHRIQGLIVAVKRVRKDILQSRPSAQFTSSEYAANSDKAPSIAKFELQEIRSILAHFHKSKGYNKNDRGFPRALEFFLAMVNHGYDGHGFDIRVSDAQHLATKLIETEIEAKTQLEIWRSVLKDGLKRLVFVMTGQGPLLGLQESDLISIKRSLQHAIQDYRCTVNTYRYNRKHFRDGLDSTIFTIQEQWRSVTGALPQTKSSSYCATWAVLKPCNAEMKIVSHTTHGDDVEEDHMCNLDRIYAWKNGCLHETKCNLDDQIRN